MSKGTRKSKSKVSVSMMDTGEQGESTDDTGTDDGNGVAQLSDPAALITGYGNTAPSTANQQQGQPAAPLQDAALQQAAAMFLAQMQNWPSNNIKLTGPKV